MSFGLCIQGDSMTMRGMKPGFGCVLGASLFIFLSAWTQYMVICVLALAGWTLTKNETFWVGEKMGGRNAQ